MNLNDFHFELPPECIAQTPAARRDASRLMIVDRRQQCITHDVFANIGHYLRQHDVLVVNDTKVIPARLHGRGGEGGRGGHASGGGSGEREAVKDLGVGR